MMSQAHPHHQVGTLRVSHQRKLRGVMVMEYGIFFGLVLIMMVVVPLLLHLGAWAFVALGTSAACMGAAAILSTIHDRHRRQKARRRTLGLWPHRARLGATHRELAAILGARFSSKIDALILKGSSPDLSSINAMAKAQEPFAKNAVPMFFTSEGFNTRPSEHVVVVEGNHPRVIQPLVLLSMPANGPSLVGVHGQHVHEQHP